MLKPADLTPNTQQAILTLINENFDPGYIIGIGGGIPECEALLRESFDFLFFTGSPRVGKIIMRAAAEHLTPVCLELGGKSPCIVDKTANIKLAAKRITWAKYLNAGQTCVSPHYIYVHQDVVAEYIRYCKHYINEFYSDDPKSSEYFGRIVSTSHCRRLVDLIDPDKVVHGGKASIEERYLEPTIIGEVTWEDPIMQAEIFGPVMPVLTFSDLNEGCSQIRAGEKPLALYIYSEQKSVHDQVLQNTSSGGACINDSLIHVANHRLPFGGVGNSGMGSYHGKKSFDLLSHHKSIHPADGFTSPADKTRSTTSTLAKLISLDTTQPAAPQTRPPSQLSKPIRALTKRAAPCPRRRPPSSGRSQNEVRRFKEIRSLY